MDELTEVKFLRTGTEYTLEKTATGFNCRQVDFDDKPPIYRSFQQLLDHSQSKQISFKGFEEKKNEAELILLNCMHEEKITNYELRVTELTAENQAIQKENETLKNIITGLEEAKKIAESEE